MQHFRGTGKPLAADGASDDELLDVLGRRLARLRVRRDCSQERLAEEAGVSRATVQRLEAGSSVQLTKLVRVLRALDLEGNLAELAPEAPVRPLEELERRGARRRRASPRRSESESEVQPDRAWTWGDDE